MATITMRVLAPLLLLCGAAKAYPGATALADRTANDTCPGFEIQQDTGVVIGTHLLKQVAATAFSQCCAACRSTPTCGGLTFNGKTCRMTTIGNASAHPVKGAVSATIPAPPPTPAPIPFPNYCRGKTCRNVLYFVADDMRSDWGTYGLPTVTPNLDSLAKKSVLFEHAYCQISVCAPSRMSFMTGRRPDTFGVWNFIDTVPTNTSATPGHFKDHGYITLGAGKTFHQALGAWNADKYWSTEDKPYFPYGVGSCPHGGQGGGHCMQTDDQIYDYHLRLTAIDYLGYAANKSKATGRPFYVMAGFRKPHAPWQYPKRMWDLYNQSAIKVAEHKVLPTGTPLIAWSRQLGVKLENGTGFSYDANTPVPDWVMQDQRHAYYSSVSYVDEHVGFILDTLNATGMQGNTVVLFHADHGYHLGEHGEWEKKSNFDLVVRVPLMIHVPWLPDTWGTRSPALFDLVNVFPTLASLAGLPVPEGVDGEDLATLLIDPFSPTGPAAAYHQYPACGCSATPAVCYNSTRQACNNSPRGTFNFMGYSVRTHAWRYTAWFPWDNTTLSADWKGPFAAELYNHTGDHSFEMDNYENVNLASQYKSVATGLHEQIITFFSEHASATAHHRASAAAAGAAGGLAGVADASDPYDM